MIVYDALILYAKLAHLMQVLALNVLEPIDRLRIAHAQQDISIHSFSVLHQHTIV